LTLVADRRRTAEADRLARFETVVARIQCQKAFDDANAARDRDGSNSPAWWKPESFAKHSQGQFSDRKISSLQEENRRSQ